jgi:hypothetical protein
VLKTLDTPVREELAHVGVVYIDAPTERFIERFKDIERFERGPGVPQIGRFSSTPRIEDLAGLTLPPGDVNALSDCEPGDCGVKLSSAAMRRFRTDVDWSSPATASRQANEVTREMILDLVRAYQATGNVALGQYDDGGEALSVADTFRAILASDGLLPVPIPAIKAYLDTYPRGRPDGAEDIFYWTMVNFGLKETIRVNHVVIVPMAPDPSAGVEYVIATKQLYASHYFHTTLELRFLVDDPRPGRRGFYLISYTRSRSDGMTGLTGLFLRSIVSRRSGNAVRKYLDLVKEQVERPTPVR